MRRRLFLGWSAAFMACLFAYPVDGRTWRDNTGKHSTEAELVAVQGDKIQLKRADGKVIDVPLAKLSHGDREFVGDEMRRKIREAGAVPTEESSPHELEQLRRQNEILLKTNEELGQQLVELSQQLVELERNVKLLGDLLKLKNEQPAQPAQAREAPAVFPAPIRRAAVGLYAGVGDGHWISEVSSDGSIITLEDGSVWKVDSFDRLDTTLWLTLSDIVVVEGSDGLAPYSLINKDDGETAGATLLSK
jgi:hypothetical protein